MKNREERLSCVCLLCEKWGDSELESRGYQLQVGHCIKQAFQPLVTGANFSQYFVPVYAGSQKTLLICGEAQIGK